MGNAFTYDACSVPAGPSKCNHIAADGGICGIDTNHGRKCAQHSCNTPGCNNNIIPTLNGIGRSSCFYCATIDERRIFCKYAKTKGLNLCDNIYCNNFCRKCNGNTANPHWGMPGDPFSWDNHEQLYCTRCKCGNCDASVVSKGFGYCSDHLCENQVCNQVKHKVATTTYTHCSSCIRKGVNYGIYLGA